MRRSFVIEETEDGIMTNRVPRTDEEHQRLDAALRRFAAKKVDELARKAVERGIVEQITYRDMKKAIRQIKKCKAYADGGMYAQLITRDGLKIYGPGTPGEIFRQWEEDVDGKKD